MQLSAIPRFTHRWHGRALHVVSINGSSTIQQPTIVASKVRFLTMRTRPRGLLLLEGLWRRFRASTLIHAILQSESCPRFVPLPLGTSSLLQGAHWLLVQRDGWVNSIGRAWLSRITRWGRFGKGDEGPIHIA